MRTNIHKTAQLGELVVAAFDNAELYSADPREVSRLATQAVINMLRRAGKDIDSTVTNNQRHSRHAATLHQETVIT